VKTLARPRDQDEILRRLKAVRPDSERRFGRMSAHQMVCHLGDAFRMAMGRKPVRSTGGLAQRTIVKWVALYLPARWPGGRIVTSPEIDQEAGGTRPTVDFAADVVEVEALMAVFTAPTRRFQWQAHPIFGRMSDAAWLRWGYLHMDHHLRQFGE
jgi:uncharacterized protein DUF1569